MARVDDDRSRAPMHDIVARFGRRRRRFQREQPRALTVALSVMGTGWTIVIPALIGFFLGRWLDERLRSGITASAALGLVGLCLGCYSAWRWIWRAQQEPR